MDYRDYNYRIVLEGKRACGENKTMHTEADISAHPTLEDSLNNKCNGHDSTNIKRKPYSDLELRKMILNAIQHDYLIDSHSIILHVYRGHVSLSGWVKNTAIRVRLAQIVHQFIDLQNYHDFLHTYSLETNGE